MTKEQNHPKDILKFGEGKLIVSAGLWHGEPAVFIEDAPSAGPRGAIMDDELGWSKTELHPSGRVLIFPTAQEAAAIASLLCGDAMPLAHDDFISGPKTEPKDGEWWWCKEDNFGPIVAARWDIDEQLDSGGSWFGVADYGSHNLKAAALTPIALVTTPEQDAAKDELIKRLVEVLSNFNIQPPDQDGDVWLHMRAKNVRSSGAVNLGGTRRILVQVAALLEQDRIAALKQARAAGYGGK